MNARLNPLDDAALLRWPLPMPEPDGDKESRGHVLVVGGSPEMPGAVLLAATAALRAGAGKLSVATGRSVAPLVAATLPESRVLALPETTAGGLALEGAALLAPLAPKLDAILIGPGMQDEAAAAAFVRAALPGLPGLPLVLDACAMAAVRDEMPPRPVLLTPHAGEMAHLTGVAKPTLQADPLSAARVAAACWQAVVALKGAVTHIACPDGTAWRHEGGNVGLGVSGSGDVLAGVIAGLLARGAALEQAAAWGVALHARAGEALARRWRPGWGRSAIWHGKSPTRSHAAWRCSSVRAIRPGAIQRSSAVSCPVRRATCSITSSSLSWVAAAICS